MKFTFKESREFRITFGVGQEVEKIQEKKGSFLIEGEHGARIWVPAYVLKEVGGKPEEEHFYQVRFLHRDNGNFIESTWKDEASASKRCESLNVLNKSELIRYQVEKVKFDNFV